MLRLSFSDQDLPGTSVKGLLAVKADGVVVAHGAVVLVGRLDLALAEEVHLAFLQQRVVLVCKLPPHGSLYCCALHSAVFSEHV